MTSFARDHDQIKRPNHSIFDQTAANYLPQVRYPYNIPSNNAHPNALSNVDGFGIRWYALPPGRTPLTERVYDAQRHDLRTSFFQPETYHSLVRPAWEDVEVRRLCEDVDSSIVFGHVRVEPGRGELLPFSFGRFLFMHNSFITGFSSDPEKLERLISPAAKKVIRGTTDSVRIFALVLTFLDPNHTGDWSRLFPRSALVSALIRVVSVTDTLYRPPAGWSHSRSHWNCLNIALSDGDSFAGARMDRMYEGELDGGMGGGGGERRRKEHEPHVVVASEPMTQGRDEGWHLLQSGEILDTSIEELNNEWRLHKQHEALHPYEKWTWKPRIRTVEQVRREIGGVVVEKRTRTSVSSLD
ncbi:glucosamine 6-phosphate synthetase [Rhodotorula toruloides]|uniref:Glucosamine 6-phosphate synthetase n=1 Tax=Rhodotorula toruloides TaxID=5286 RepID=A0A511KKM0_RHOTO|nr:glucosamine 6-phosphate synthetase [Rhodotorula toruloides]